MKSTVKILLIAALMALMSPVTLMAGDTQKGDVNGDGVVSILDVTALIDHILTNTVDSVIFNYMDLNNDGGVSISDATTLIDYLLVGDWVMDENGSMTVNNESSTMDLVKESPITTEAIADQLEVAHPD